MPHVTPAEVPDAVRGAFAGRAERAVVAASARADQLIVARDGDRAQLGGGGSWMCLYPAGRG